MHLVSVVDVEECVKVSVQDLIAQVVEALEHHLPASARTVGEEARERMQLSALTHIAPRDLSCLIYMRQDARKVGGGGRRLVTGLGRELELVLERRVDVPEDVLLVVFAEEVARRATVLNVSESLRLLLLTIACIV